MIVFDVIFAHETAKAVLVEYRGAEIWLPKSVTACDWYGRGLEPGDEIEIGVPVWLAKNSEMIP